MMMGLFPMWFSVLACVSSLGITYGTDNFSVIPKDWSNHVRIHGDDCRYYVSGESSIVLSTGCQMTFFIPQMDMTQFTPYHLEQSNYEPYLFFKFKFVAKKYSDVDGMMRLNTFFANMKQYSFDFDTNSTIDMTGDYNIPWLAGTDFTDTSPNQLAIVTEVINNKQHTDNDWNVIEISNLSFAYLPQPKKVFLTKKTMILLPTPSSSPSSPLNNHTIQTCFNHNHTLEQCQLLGSPHANALRTLLPLPFMVEKVTTNDNDSSDKNNTAEEKEEILAPKVFCGIFTMASKHSTQVKATRDTWASKCTSFLAFSTLDDPTIPSINLPHIGHEHYSNMWQKSRSIWQYLAMHYINEYDWFLLGGDDMYYLIENLYTFLMSKEIQLAHNIQKEGLYLGRKFYNKELNITYHTGGPGYLLNSYALKRLASFLSDPLCRIHEFTSMEDIYLSNCLLQMIPPILPYSTLDSYHLPRFHYFSPGFLYDPKRSNTSNNIQSNVSDFDYIVTYADPSIQFGNNNNQSISSIISNTSIAFHFIDYDVMYAIHQMLYTCPIECITRYYDEYGHDYYEIEYQQMVYRSQNKGYHYRL